MPKARQRMNVVSFWVRRPEEHPHAPDYVPLLYTLQRSCDRLGLRHVVLTDDTTTADWPAGLEAFRTNLPLLLMRAATEAHARWTMMGDWQGCDTLFTGADACIVRHPDLAFPKLPALCVTMRTERSKQPINTGAMMVRQHSRAKTAAMYREVADRCGSRWCDDQRAIVNALSPLPPVHGTFERRGFSVAFLPMRTFNFAPRSADDPPGDAVLVHFRQQRKAYMPAWAAKHLGV